jgi:hypothetical protein
MQGMVPESRHARRERLMREDQERCARFPHVGDRRAERPSAADGWVRWLAPRFKDGSAYITGTYTDEYGFANGCTLPRNVHKDFRRFLKECGAEGHDFINGVEHHQYRDVLHLHAVLKGPYDAGELEWLKAYWSAKRGHARVLPVLDGCASYVTKYALKGDAEAFDWSLS